MWSHALLKGFSSFVPQQVREMETWMPMNATMTTHPDDLVASGDSPNGSDFGFTDDKYTAVDAEDGGDDDDDTLFDDEDQDKDSEFSGSGDGGRYRDVFWLSVDV